MHPECTDLSLDQHTQTQFIFNGNCPSPKKRRKLPIPGSALWHDCVNFVGGTITPCIISISGGMVRNEEVVPVT